MKNYIISEMKNLLKLKAILGVVLAFAALAALQSCSKEKDSAASIYLEAPADNALIYLEDGNVRFAWSADSEVKDGFTLVLTGTSENQTRSYKLLPTAYSREIVASDFDALLKEWGAKSGENFILLWNVNSTVEGQGKSNGERTLKIRVLP